MTRKDYIAAVKLLKEFDRDGNFSRKVDKKNVMVFLSEFFQKDNPKFSKQRFLEACDE